MSTVAALLLVAVALLSLPLMAQAQAEARVIIRHASQLVDDDAVRRLAEPYRLGSIANVFVAQCGEVLALTEAQKQYIAKSFADTSTTYMRAFDMAFQARTGTASPKELVDEYYQYLLAQQTEAATIAARTVKNNSCNDTQIRDIVRYYDKLQAQEGKVTSPALAAPAAPATEPGIAPATAPTTTTPQQ